MADVYFQYLSERKVSEAEEKEISEQVAQTISLAMQAYLKDFCSQQEAN